VLRVAPLAQALRKLLNHAVEIALITISDNVTNELCIDEAFKHTKMMV
jgi:hypothetical protein